MPVKVKICGITRLEDALEAARLGADALGFNFWAGSKRRVSQRIAREIVRELPPFVTAVGVFVNATAAQVVGTAKRVGLPMVQLHGDETPRFCARIPIPVIKALAVDGPEALAALERFSVAAFLLDAPSLGRGGSGQRFDLRILDGRLEGVHAILAGGLDPTNVAEAIRAARPYAVDVASGVESAPGIKDHAKMARFIAAAKGA